MKHVSRRNLMATGLAAGAALGLSVPQMALARRAKELSWDDLIPPGVPYGEIIGEGELDEAADTWSPIFDENATKLNGKLHGAYVRLPGFIIPIEQDAKGVSEFVLVPYVGACIHTPPPPPNQLVLVRAIDPWPSDNLWEAVWVEGRMSAQLMSTEVAETGYALTAEKMEVYVWE